jgi:hypothetical protein
LLNDETFIGKSAVTWWAVAPANQFHTAVVRLVMGLRALEAIGKRVVDIDSRNFRLTGRRSILRLDARQHHQFGPFVQ